MNVDNIAHNLANASTNGYKKSHVVFEDLMYQNLRQAGAPLALRIDAKNLPTVRLGDPAQLEVGDPVLAIGAPFGFEQTAIEVTAKKAVGTMMSCPFSLFSPFLDKK